MRLWVSVAPFIDMRHGLPAQVPICLLHVSQCARGKRSNMRDMYKTEINRATRVN